MDVTENWQEVKELFTKSFKSSFHYAIATVNLEGEPHVTPIGSLILGRPGHGIYFEEFPRQLPDNLNANKNICVLAVNSGRWFWIKSLMSGRFSSPPAVRLHGAVGEVRQASEKEVKLWQNRVKRVSFSKGHAMMWSNMKMVRDITFTSIEPVHMGEMTRDTWNNPPNIKDT